VDLFNKVFSPLFFKSLKVPSPYCYRCPIDAERRSCNIDCIKPLENLLKKKSNGIAGIILEPIVMAAGGMIIYPKEYLAKVSKLCKEYEVHLIIDEVATGFGRTGKMFACEHANVKPDFMCVSKGITSGYLPFAATLTTDKVYKAFYADYDKHKTFFHGHTYTANPIGCAAALASLRIFEEEDVLKTSTKIWKLLHKELESFRKLDFVGDVRYIGGIGALELVKNRSTKEPFPSKDRIGEKIYKEGLKKNIILRPLGNIAYFFLPLCIKEIEMLTIIERAKKVISAFA
ncbi:MAG: aminotransferase class III-fold pyridoxal phosphate-dependent enzyme, partial [Candidatus Omnitrophota bacterium]